jgi:hypothetical protein
MAIIRLLFFFSTMSSISSPPGILRRTFISMRTTWKLWSIPKDLANIHKEENERIEEIAQKRMKIKTCIRLKQDVKAKQLSIEIQPLEKQLKALNRRKINLYRMKELILRLKTSDSDLDTLEAFADYADIHLTNSKGVKKKKLENRFKDIERKLKQAGSDVQIPKMQSVDDDEEINEYNLEADNLLKELYEEIRQESQNSVEEKIDVSNLKSVSI